MQIESEVVRIRVHGGAELPALVYLPGLHGDWTLVPGFRAALEGRVRFVEMTYPRSLAWSIADYSEAIVAGLRENGVSHGWLLAESFGSQFAWEIAGHLSSAFKPDGIILAGGFVKHPFNWGPSALRWIGDHTSMARYRRELRIYACYSRFRNRHSPENVASVSEFVERRTEQDRRAMRHRLTLLDQYDPRPIARQTRIPVHYLAGLVDPLVPWPLVRLWMRRNCPGYRGGKTFLSADHNVLATQPSGCAKVVMKWITQ